ncbi:MAG: copper chaperone PCu(A)C [Burkholderiaceae bacterium]
MISHSRLFIPALSCAAACAGAHVVLPPGGAAAGSTYAAAFKVGHACKGSTATTALAIHLPDGFTLVRAQPRDGWALETGPHDVRWTASNPKMALPGASSDSFVVVGKLTSVPGPLWFRASQTCDAGSADWAAVPGAGNAKPEFPAPRLDVLAPGVAALDVRDAWARPTVAGQPAAALYAVLTAPSGGRVVGATSAVGAVSLHEMRMDGDVMRMRELDDGLELPPGQAVPLSPNGLHFMLTGLKQPLIAGTQVPLTLRFVDREGRKGDLDVQVPVGAAPPAAGGEHRHPG